MDDEKNRIQSRDSLFLLAEVSVAGVIDKEKVRVRNLSAGGMMADGDFGLQRGAAVQINLRNIGEVTGQIAWTGNGKFGIAFDSIIDPQKVRAAPATTSSIPHGNLKVILPTSQLQKGVLRKI